MQWCCGDLRQKVINISAPNGPLKYHFSFSSVRASKGTPLSYFPILSWFKIWLISWILRLADCLSFSTLYNKKNWISNKYQLTLLSTSYVTYTVLYHDCSDLSHVLVFTITWQKRNQVISWYKTNIDCSIFGGWLNLLPLGVLETVTIFPWAFGPRENSSGLQSTSGK